MSAIETSTADPPRFHAVVLAGERPGGSRLARSLDLPAGVLAPLAGVPCIERVLDALCTARLVSDALVCGPAQEVVGSSPELERLLRRDGVRWRAPAHGPAASALAATADTRFPLLLTSGDHGLLQATVVDEFCRQAWGCRDRADVVVGLVPFERVRQEFPESRRTVLRFADGAHCGSNLFALLNPDSRNALSFWRTVEAERKRPWRIAGRLGTWTLLRYLLRRLPADRAFATLSERAGCRITWLAVTSARAAVDVDSEDDWRLADRLLSADAAAGADADSPT